MKQVYRSDDPLLLGFLRQLLEDSGVRCVARNEYLGGGAGQLPLNECWPELWVLDDQTAGTARRLIEEALAAPSGAAEPWRCAACGEQLEAQFALCWRCGAARG